ncbi:hypothetical protein ABT215_11065 [Streptomyces sp900105755]|uniref:hypothetical protein n=1 Tax=Streptomyces sp. 900105755 TaxID=3154389 RepID=UPI0033222E76
MRYTPHPRRRSDAELAELKAGAKNLRDRARRTQAAGDPDQAERDFRAAEMNEAEIQAELDQRRR